MAKNVLFGKRPREADMTVESTEKEKLDKSLDAELVKGRVKRTITEADIRDAITLLNKYKQGKANLESRIIDDELWWELRHWESIGKGRRHSRPKAEPTSAWLFNGILNKHADAMDNYPEAMVLPRERSDEGSAKVLCEILPVIMEYNRFEDVYSANWWEKLKHGTGAYGVFWNTEKENGLGDIDIRVIDLLNLFWEPGVTNIQDSRNVFVTQLVDNDLLIQQYPKLKNKLGGDVIKVGEYMYDDTVDTSEKSVVVDWYYKVKAIGGKTVLHYVKFVGENLLYASENDEQYKDRGFYDHGMYPIVLDVMFPEKGTPVGFGYIAISKDPQIYIDKLSANIMESSLMATKKRFFVSSSTNVNEDEFCDYSRNIVRVEGELDDTRIREIEVSPLSPIYYNVLQGKIEEMKDTTANRDVNSGGAGNGVTAAAAISALQEAGNKVSRDMISTSYRAFTDITNLCIELIRQFYDEARAFRITGEDGAYQFVDIDNSLLKEQVVVPNGMNEELFRKPIFDLKIKAQRSSPFSRMEQNERAKELYQLGFFAPEKAQEALNALDMMEFEGIEKIKDDVRQGQTLLNIVKQMSQQLEQMSGMLGMGSTIPAENGDSAPTGGSSASDADTPALDGNSIGTNAARAQRPMTPYGQALAKRSTPSIDQRSKNTVQGGE